MSTPSTPHKFAAVFGSPGLRIRISGFYRVFWPFLLVVFVTGCLLGWLFPLPLGFPKFPLVLFMLALALGSYYALNMAGIRFNSFLKGAKGEEITARELTFLGPGWDIFHSVPVAARDASRVGPDFDHIVVGPDSIFLVETKNWEGVVKVEKGIPRQNGTVVKRSPVVQVRREARVLSRMLEQSLPPDFNIVKIVCFASNNLEGEEAVADDVLLCNVRSLRSTIMESPPGALTDSYRKLVIDVLARKAP